MVWIFLRGSSASTYFLKLGVCLRTNLAYLLVIWPSFSINQTIQVSKVLSKIFLKLGYCTHYTQNYILAAISISF